MIYKATVNGLSFEIEKLKKENTWRIGNKEVVPDTIKLKPGSFHALVENKSYRIEILKSDKETKSVTLSVNGKVYTVTIKDQYDELLHRLGMDSVSHHRVNDLKAPMPGLVVSIHVKEGQAVKTGDALITLEAMKMENVLKASGEGIVGTIKVKPRQAVEKNEVLIQFQ